MIHLTWWFCSLQSYVNYITYMEMKRHRLRPTRVIIPFEYEIIAKGDKYTTFHNKNLDMAHFKGIVKFGDVKRPVVSI